MKHLATICLIGITFYAPLHGEHLSIMTEVSVGELFDKITILHIKLPRLKSEQKRWHVTQELEILQNICTKNIPMSEELTVLINELRTINATLWGLEDDIRRKEAHKCHDEEFKQIAAAILKNNDKRAQVKAAINAATNSAVLEEKSYNQMHATQRKNDSAPTKVTIEIPFAELIDKITILEVKLDNISDPAKRSHISEELFLLYEIRDNACTLSAELQELTDALRTANRTMFEIQDKLRVHLQTNLFDDAFVHLARSVYVTNDERCRIKHLINDYSGSRLVEEKEYTEYDTVKI